MSASFEFHKKITELTTGEHYIEPPLFHKEILDLYNNDDRLQCIVAPVGFAKSTTIKSHIIREIFRGCFFALYVTSSFSKVVDQFTGLLKTLSDPLCLAMFKYEIIEKTQTSITLQFKDGRVSRISGVASGQDISGINFQNHRPSLIVVDDIEELEQARSIARTEKLIEWIDITLLSRLPSLTEGKVRMIGTNLTLNSIINRMIKNEILGWKVYRFTAFDENNQSRWETRHPTEALLEFQAKNPFVFASNYLNAPMDTANSLINYDDLRFYDLLPNIKNVYIHSDTTHTGKQTSDYFATGIIGEADNNFYLIDYILEKCDVEKQAEHMISFYLQYRQKYNIMKMTYDAVSNDGFGFWTKKLASSRNISLPLEARKYPKDKVSHFSTHIPHFKANRVYLPKEHRYNKILIDQVLAFPTNGVHDDGVDMISSLLDNFNKPVWQTIIL